MSERSEQIRKTLESIGVDPVTTSDVSKQIARREELLKAHPLAYEYAHEVRERYAERQSLTFDEAVEVYRKVPELQMLGARKRVSGTDKDARDSLIVMYLLILHQCGLPVTSHADDRSMKSSRTTLPSDERMPCLAWAMERATGIGEGTIARAWSDTTRRWRDLLGVKMP